MKTFHDMKGKQINFLDERYYTFDNEHYYPSVTHVLDVYPKGFGFMQWLKDMGNNAEEVVKRAADRGSKIHNTIDMYLKGNEILWANSEGKAMYDLDEWLMISRFVEFWTTYKPEIITSEESMLSEALGFGGTLDIVCRIGRKKWLIDTKTGNAVHKSHELQLAAYAMMWNEAHPSLKIDEVGIMHLKAATRGPDKTGKEIQGKGWQLKRFERPYEQSFDVFKHVYALWKEVNPNPKPKNLVYPDSFKLEVAVK